MDRLVLLVSVISLTVLALPSPRGNRVVQLPLRRRHQPVLPAQRGPGKHATAVRNGNENRAQEERLADNAQPLVRNFTDSGPFDDFGVFQDEIFTVEVLLGTPAKQFNVTLDYRWWQAFFFSAGHPKKQCKYAGAPSRRDYDPRDSSSDVYDRPFGGIGLGAPYVPHGCTTLFTENSIMYNDTLTIGGASFNIPFLYITDTLGNLDSYWPSDAILGLNRREKGEPTDEYAIYGILGALPQNVVTVYFDSKEDTSTDMLNGQLTFGGIDAQNCASRWDYCRNSIPLGAPTPKVVDEVIAQTGAEYDFHTNAFFVPCAKVGTFPDMVFQFGTFEYRLPDKDYIRKLPHNHPGQCTLMLQGANFEEDMWRLGSTFGRSYCTLLDYDNERIGFAKVLY
ncbi:aspartic protease [Aphelenchoides avenae]|nr:aspartic protease [Aphelenchus avenae]